MLSCRIHYPENEVAALHSIADISHHFPSQRTVRGMHSWGVNEDNLSCRSSLFFGNMHDPKNAIARGLRFGTDNRQLLADEFVQQSGFAGVGTAEDANESGAKGHVAGLYQLHLSGLGHRDSHPLYAPLRRLQHFETQSIIFD